MTCSVTFEESVTERETNILELYIICKQNFAFIAHPHVFINCDSLSDAEFCVVI